MAFYKKSKLPPLKLTHRTSGRVKKVLVHRGTTSAPKGVGETNASESSETGGGGTGEPVVQTDPEFVEPTLHELQRKESDPEFVEPTLHEVQRKASVKGWESIRSKLLTGFTESAFMPEGQLCVICSESADILCDQCGPVAFLCRQCFNDRHENTNTFHVPKEWKEDHYEIGEIKECSINVRPQHECSTISSAHLLCMDEYGMEHAISVICCDCEPLPVTLTRARLWPASPCFPKYAFSFDLLDWAEALLLECHVSLKDFCSALFFRCPYSVKKRRNIYSCLIDAFEEYRFFKHKIRHLSYLSKDFDLGNVCPACPKGNGKVVISLDGLFGLPRKKSAGVSYREPVQGHLFFCNQHGVDEYVTAQSVLKKVNVVREKTKNDCSNFLAGSMLRSANRYKALDETAVFGAACRHEFPYCFLI